MFDFSNFISTGIQFSILSLSLLLIFKFVILTSNINAKIVLAYLDKGDNITTMQIAEHDGNEVYLPHGYTVAQYKYKKDINVLYLFIKHHTYLRSALHERIRHLNINHDKSITIHENYEEEHTS